MKFPIKTSEELEKKINNLRAIGVNVSYKQARIEIICKIIDEANPRQERFAISKLPDFNGNFVEFKTECRAFFVSIYESKIQKRMERKREKKTNV